MRLISHVVEHLDLSPLRKLYKERGRSPHDPKMLLKVVIYAYMNNIYSCRKIEKALKRDVHFIWLAGYEQPDFITVNRFRNGVKNEINNVFTQLVLLLCAKGLVTLDVEYIDGTKIESKANKYTFVWRKTVERNRAKLMEKIRVLLSEYDDRLETLGGRNSYSKTDPDATFMRMKEDAMNNGQTKPGYNLQISTENQFIINYGLYDNRTDTLTMIPFLNSFYERYGHFSKEISADSGYGSQENYAFMASLGIEAYVKYNLFHKEQTQAFKNDIFRIENLHYNPDGDYFVCPMGQHMNRVRVKYGKTESGYRTEIVVYRAERCEGCPLRWGCHRRRKVWEP